MYVATTVFIILVFLHVHPMYVLIYDVCRILRNEIGQYWLKSAKCARRLVCIACTHTHTRCHHVYGTFTFTHVINALTVHVTTVAV